MRDRFIDCTVPTALSVGFALGCSFLAAGSALAAPAAAPAASMSGASQDAAPKGGDVAAAQAAFRKIIDAYRDPRGVEVEVSARVGAARDGREEFSPPVEAKFLLSSGRRAIVSLRGFDLRIAGGKITATHGSNPLTYLQVSDNDSPYYALFNAFQGLPFPELALSLGETDPSEVAMQLLPQLPNVLPSRVEKEEVDGQVAEVLVLASDDASEELRLAFDPETHLLERASGVLLKGDAVEEGAKLIWQITSKTRRPKDAPVDATFALDLSSRQKVDGLAALIDRSKEAEEDIEVEGLKVGDPAPELALPRSGGGDWNLATARAKPVVIDFWATWCGPCRAAMPELAKLQKEFAGRAEVMLVNSGEQGSREEREQRIKEVLGPIEAKFGALASVLDLDSMAARRWLVRAFPTTFLIGTDGRIAGVWIGSSPASQRELREKLEALCAAKPADGAPAAPKDPAPAPPKPDAPAAPKPDAPAP